MIKKKFILAYSGGLDTSIIIPWLKEEYDCDVITYSADLGQEIDFAAIKNKAIESGAKEAIIGDVKEEFVQEYVFPLLKSGAKYENKYLLGTISRPLIAKKLTEVAKKYQADAIVHGATGKGNDQVRFEIAIATLMPDITIIAPWRHPKWKITSREEAIDYAESHNIPVSATKTSIYSVDENIWYTSHEGGVLEDCIEEAPENIYQFTTHPKNAIDKEEIIEIDFQYGIPVALNAKNMNCVEILQSLNIIGKKHGIGCLDIVESRLIGMKSRGVYEFPAGEILYQTHQILESVVLDRETLFHKQKIALDYGNLVYDGKWFSMAKNAMDEYIKYTQNFVSGKVKVKLYKGNIFPVSIYSKQNLYNKSLASFSMNEDYNQNDADGFIKIVGLSMKNASKVNNFINLQYEK